MKSKEELFKEIIEDFNGNEFLLNKIDISASKEYINYRCNKELREFLKEKIIEKAKNGEKIIEYDVVKWAIEFLEKNVKTLANMIKDKEEIEKIKKEWKIESSLKSYRKSYQTLSYVFPKEIALLFIKYVELNQNNIRNNGSLLKYIRNCITRIINESKMNIEEIEKIFKEEAEKFEGIRTV
jgi:hypothetical protein